MFNNIDWRNSNLCKYFWQVVFSVVISLFVIGIIGALIWIFIIRWREVLVVVGFSTFIWVPILAVVGLRMTGVKTGIKNPKQLNLLSEYLKAKIEKICPIIEFR